MINTLVQENGACSRIKRLIDIQQEEQEDNEAAKMKSLNSMTQGISHALNTPLGIGITASSYNISLINDLISELSASDKVEDEFIARLKVLLSSNELVYKNIQKSADIISKLKSTVITRRDETADENNLSCLVKKILACLKNEFGSRLANCTIETEIPSDITVCVRANYLWEVLKQLIDNSLVHGFSRNEKGMIRISAISHCSGITISYSDDGCGIEGLILNRIFEPFFTRKCDSDRSGLGMTAVYNLVTQCMNGKIKCFNSEIGGIEVMIFLEKTENQEA